jgi:glycosyltransferase involved in cell wall biosynthesis
VARSATQAEPAEIEAALLTGGGDPHYAFSLAMGLVSKGVAVDFIGGDEGDRPEMHATLKLHFHHFRRSSRKGASFIEKGWGLLAYYGRLIRYAAIAKPKVFHILWNNKFEHFDRTVLMLYYKLLGKRTLLTAHNINAGVRDSKDSWLNRLTLRIQYRLTDHIFVHTEQMRTDLVEGFGVRTSAVTIIPMGINDAVPSTALTCEEAKHRLGIKRDEKVILFFGNITAYKGLEFLITAFERLVTEGGNYRLIVAGRAKKDSDPYVADIVDRLNRKVVGDRTILRMTFIPDEDLELYFKAADVAVLPYTMIYQSGVLFLAYGFGLPAIVSDAGSLRQDVVEGETGFVCRSGDPVDLAMTIDRYFASDLYRDLDTRRGKIRDCIQKKHSWDTVSECTLRTYVQALQK